MISNEMISIFYTLDLKECQMRFLIKLIEHLYCHILWGRDPWQFHNSLIVVSFIGFVHNLSH